MLEVLEAWIRGLAQPGKDVNTHIAISIFSWQLSG